MAAAGCLNGGCPCCKENISCPHHKRMIFTDSLRILIKEDSQALLKAQAVPLDPLVLVKEGQQM